jgi:hypothetical protein
MNDPIDFVKEADFAGLCAYLARASWVSLHNRKFAKCRKKAIEMQCEIANSPSAKRLNAIIDDMCLQVRKREPLRINHCNAIQHLRDEWRRKYIKYHEIERRLLRTEMMKDYAKKYRREFGFAR